MTYETAKQLRDAFGHLLELQYYDEATDTFKPGGNPGGGGEGGGGDASAANQTAVIGSKAGGTAAASSLLVGGLYNTTAPTMTNGQQASLQYGLRGSLKVQFMTADGTAGAEVTAGNADGITGPNGKMAAAAYGYNHDPDLNTYTRTKGNAKGTYVVAAVPDITSSSVTAQPVTGTSVGAASLIATITNTNFRYKKAVIHVTNQTAIAFTDFVIRTKCNPSDASYDTTYTANGYAELKGYIQELTVNPATLSNGECRIVIDISIFSSLQIAAVVQSASPGTTAIARWFLLDV